jgi:protein ImuB
VIACIAIPGFELRAALRSRPGLEVRPAALAPLPGKEAFVGPVTAAAATAGVRVGMRLGEALAMCPGLVLVEQDPATAEQAWEEILQRLEDRGFAVEPVETGCVYFETKGVERLYGGLEPALKRALEAVGPLWDARAGAADRRFAALAAAGVARAGQALIVSDAGVGSTEPGKSTGAGSAGAEAGMSAREFLAPLPLTLLPLDRSRYEELEELGVRKLGQLAGLPGGAVAERLGPDGRRAWSLARGEEDGRVRPRRAPEQIVEVLEFPEAVGNELTLRRALTVLVDRLVARDERAGRPARKLAITARLVGGASWRRTVTLRDPSADPARLREEPGPKMAQLPSPAVKLKLEFLELAEHQGEQLELVRAEGDVLRDRLREGLRQVRASVGVGGVSTVVEVAPWSRIPEARALLVPRDD